MSEGGHGWPGPWTPPAPQGEEAGRFGEGSKDGTDVAGSQHNRGNARWGRVRSCGCQEQTAEGAQGTW